MRDRAALVPLALVVLVALAGCSGLLTDPSLPTGDEAREGYESLRAIEGTVEYRSTLSGNGSHLTVRVVRRPKQGMTRQRILAPPRMAGDVTVTNGSVSWFYDASQNSVTRISLEGMGNISNTTNAEFVETLFGNLTASQDDPTIAVSALPTVPTGGASVGSSALATVDFAGTVRLNVTYLGTRTIAGRRTHGVKLAFPETSAGLASYVENATYWFDAEYFYPLRTETVISIDGNVSRSIQVYRNVTFNPEIEPGTFRFEPPENATVETLPQSRTLTFDSARKAAANVSFDVPRLTPPGNFSLESATVTRSENRTSVLLDYSNGTADFVVSIRRPPTRTDPEGETVDLGPVVATQSSGGDLTIVRWRCGGSRYLVSGSLSPEAIRDVARAVAKGCPSSGEK